MGRAEEKYEYLSKRDKYDPDVRKAVGNKSLSEKDANKVNKIQEIMKKEREKKSSRSVVTSENREEFMKKKLKLADKQEPVYDKDDEGSDTWQVRYTNHEGEVKPPHANYDNEEAANKHAKKAVLRELGGKYTVHKIKMK